MVKRIHYSWIILCIVFFSIITAGIIRSSSGVFIVPFEEDFGWERSTISFAFALAGMFCVLACLFVIVIKKQHVVVKEAGQSL